MDAVRAEIRKAAQRGAALRLLRLWADNGTPIDTIAAANLALQVRKQDPAVALPDHTLKYIASRVRLCSRPDGRALGSLLYALHSQEAGWGEVASAVADRLLDSRASLDQQTVGMALYGLNRKGQSAHARVIIERVAARIGPATRLDEVAVANSLYGLRGVVDSAEARGLLRVLSGLLGGQGPLRAQCAANALYGLHSMDTSDSTEAVLSALAKAVAAGGDLDSQHLSTSLYGLHRRASTPGARRVVLALTPHVAAVSNRPSPLEVSNALLGLRGQTNTCEVNSLLHSLVRWCASWEAAGPVDPLCVTNFLYGLSRQGSTPATRRLLAELLPMLAETERMTESTLRMAAYGLHGHGPTAEVRAVLRGLLPLTGAVRRLSWTCLGTALYGLHGQGAVPEVTRLVGELAPRVFGDPDSDSAGQALHGVLALCDAGAPLHDLLHRILQRIPQRARGTNAAVSLVQMLSVAGAKVPPAVLATASRAPSGAACAKEVALRGLLQRAGVPGLQFNVQHRSGFELDILSAKVNVEIDGSSVKYRSAGKQRMRVLRDRMLQDDYGITVHRVDATQGVSLQAVVQQVAEACGVSASERIRIAWGRAKGLAALGWPRALSSVGCLGEGAWTANANG
eukprot:TRINITY_DN5042_c0_g1_i1.p1 TRINITY_DN5042_c0_g1~~TRINITY_DN5042_c0_g1_i1.p1  ORF type:complete len:626 (+),score=188.76 TRINITY_DN5042_c0_g1_i1:86-1963(+)